ncbi:MAG: DUF456 domain-containing protein [Desulfobacterales bacterium]
MDASADCLIGKGRLRAFTLMWTPLILFRKMVQYIFLVALGLITAIIGVLACILPILPGPLISYSSLLILSWARDWEAFGLYTLIFLGGLTLFFSIIDNIIPVVGAKTSGAGRQGVWGSILGMVIGIFFMPPWGVFLGSFAGAVVGEMLFGLKGRDALRVGWGVFLGGMVGIGLKLAFSLTLLFLYVYRLF